MGGRMKARKISKQRAYQLRQREKGLCVLCPSPAWRSGSSYCRSHLDRHLERKRATRDVDLRQEGA